MTMYAIESNTHYSEPYKKMFDLVGEKTELDTCIANIASVVLAATDTIIGEEDAFHVLRSLSSKEIVSSDRAIFGALHNDWDRLADERLRTLVAAAASGVVSSTEIIQEFNKLNFFDQYDSIRWLNKDGLQANLDASGNLDIETGEYAGTPLKEMMGSESIEYKIAEELGLNDYTFQYEMVRDSSFNEPRLVSDRAHVSLGNTDDEGNYTPIVTVLDESHPAVSQ